MDSLFDRVGGAGAVKAAVAEFYDRVLADARLAPFFEGTETHRLMAKQRAFLRFALGGAEAWTGVSLRGAHALAVSQGLSESHFGWVAEHLQATLESLGVEKDLVTEIIEVVASTQDDVLGH